MTRRRQTSVALRQAIQSSGASIRALANRHGINPKTAAKWRNRDSPVNLKSGPRHASASLSAIEEALVLTFRRHVILPLDDTLHALHTILPRLTRSSLHRCLQRHELSRAPMYASDGDLGEIRMSGTLIGSHLLIVAVETNSKFLIADLLPDPDRSTPTQFLQVLLETAPFPVRRIITRPAMGDAAFDAQCSLRGIAHLRERDAEGWSQADIARITAIVKEAVRSSDLMAVLATTAFRRRFAAALNRYNTRCTLRTLDGQSPQACIRRQRRGARTLAAHPGLAGENRKRDPRSTREALFEAARGRLAHDGPEGLSLAEVARIAGVNRGTAYLHFKTRDQLIDATAEWVSDKLFRAVFGDPSQVAQRPAEKADVAAVTDRLANFAMDNPELCRAWLLRVLSSPNPSEDSFWREYQGSTAQFAATGLAQKNIDTEVLSVIMLAGAFLWPIWARSHARRKEEMRPLARRFAQECLRISMYGNLRSEAFPEIVARLRGQDAAESAQR